MRHVIGSQLKCVVSDGETPAPVLPVVALIWTSLLNKLLAARVIKPIELLLQNQDLRCSLRFYVWFNSGKP
jgi:hypothetical protein